MFSLLSCLTMTNQAKKYTCISLLKKVEPQSTPIYYYLIAINSQWKVFHKVCIGEVFRTTETNDVLARIYLKWHHNSFFRYTWCILWPLHASSTYLKSLYLELKALEQWGWEQWKGFSPVWQNTWSRSLSCELKRAPHTKHSFPLPLPSRSLSFSFSVSLSVLPCSGTSKHFGGASSFLVLQRQCGNMVWGIGGSCCHGSPRVPLPLKLGRGCLAFQALVRYRGDV